MPPTTKKRILAYAAAWIIALMATGTFAINLLPLFPLGLFLAFVQPGKLNSGFFGFLFVGWLTYAIQAAFLFLTSSRKLYFVAYAILIIMLLTNVVGCRKLLEGLSNIMH